MSKKGDFLSQISKKIYFVRLTKISGYFLLILQYYDYVNEIVNVTILILPKLNEHIKPKKIKIPRIRKPQCAYSEKRFIINVPVRLQELFYFCLMLDCTCCP